MTKSDVEACRYVLAGLAGQASGVWLALPAMAGVILVY